MNLDSFNPFVRMLPAMFAKSSLIVTPLFYIIMNKQIKKAFSGNFLKRDFSTRNTGFLIFILFFKDSFFCNQFFSFIKVSISYSKNKKNKNNFPKSIYYDYEFNLGRQL